MNYEPRRHEMWKRIEAAQSRNARKLVQRAAATRDGAIRLAKEHPLKLLGGAVALGAIAALVIPQRNRRFLGRKSSALAAFATRMIAHYATDAHAAMKSARATGQEKATKLGDSLLDRAAGLRGDAQRLTSEASGIARDVYDDVAQKVNARIGK